jgi:AcrR family transcriptional regulator
MGNREDLLDGAVRCLLEKGYGRTTARDIAQASGVSLAAIGYHFGSKDALMNQALYRAIEDWGNKIEAVFDAAGPSLTARERFEQVFGAINDAFDAQKELWLASFELIMQLDHIPGAKDMFREMFPQARSGLMSLFLGIDEETISADDARAIGGIYYSLMVGVLVQRFADPDAAPTPQDLARGLRAVADSLDPGGS